MISPTLKLRDNCFDAVRVLAAVLVLFSHSWPIGIGEKDPVLLGIPAGTVGVYIFFALSGFLITHSAKRSTNAFDFFKSRALRIYPALIVCVFLSAFILGPFITSLALSDYLISADTYKYLLNASAIKLEPILPGVFSDNHLTTVNGSLWTLPYEILFYIVFYVLVKLRNIASTPFLLLCLLIVSGHFLGDSSPKHLSNILKLGPAFCAGALISYFSITKKNLLILLLSGIATLALSLAFGSTRLGSAIFSVGVGSTFLALAYLAPKVRLLPKFVGDISYGLYIYAFPVQQALSAALTPAEFGLTFVFYIILSILCTAVLATLSWHLIERRALLYK